MSSRIAPRTLPQVSSSVRDIWDVQKSPRTLPQDSSRIRNIWNVQKSSQNPSSGQFKDQGYLEFLEFLEQLPELFLRSVQESGISGMSRKAPKILPQAGSRIRDIWNFWNFQNSSQNSSSGHFKEQGYLECLEQLPELFFRSVQESGTSGMSVTAPGALHVRSGFRDKHDVQNSSRNSTAGQLRYQGQLIFRTALSSVLRSV